MSQRNQTAKRNDAPQGLYAFTAKVSDTAKWMFDAALVVGRYIADELYARQLIKDARQDTVTEALLKVRRSPHSGYTHIQRAIERQSKLMQRCQSRTLEYRIARARLDALLAIRAEIDHDANAVLSQRRQSQAKRRPAQPKIRRGKSTRRGKAADAGSPQGPFGLNFFD